MLKGNDGTTTCSLTSCRIKAETLARALNSRIWPCTWADRRTTDGDGTREEEDEEFFEASPSPIEEDEGSGLRGRDSSAATAEGRAKLYELLQQHADDATDVFYDVSEHAGVSETDCESQRETGLPAEDAAREVSAGEPADHCRECRQSVQKETDSCELPSTPSNSPTMKSNSTIGDVMKTSSFEGDDVSAPGTNLDSDGDRESQSQLEYETCAQNSTMSDRDPSPEAPESCIPNGIPETTPEPEDEIVIEVTKDHGEGDSSKVPSPVNTSPSDNCRLMVFTELRPMITRSTSLKTGKTPPGTPSRKKIVRFADVLGLDLEDVRHIVTGDLPTVPSSAYDDLNLCENDLHTEVPASPTVELKGKQQGTWDSVTAVTVPNALYPKFPIPGQQADFMDRVRSRGVCLENVAIAEFSVQGTCRVMNWDFNKRVVVRYTTNGWSSVSDINASYVSGSTRDNTDRFAFNLFLAPSHGRVEFALRFEVNGKEYWDNNGGENYCICRHGNGGTTHAVSVPCSPSWMNEFW